MCSAVVSICPSHLGSCLSRLIHKIGAREMKVVSTHYSSLSLSSSSSPPLSLSLSFLIFFLYLSLLFFLSVFSFDIHHKTRCIFVIYRTETNKLIMFPPLIRFTVFRPSSQHKLSLSMYSRLILIFYRKCFNYSRLQ